MKCPRCGTDDAMVVDTRSVQNAAIIRRRRRCTGCGFKFNTFERLEEVPLRVIKSDDRREPFSADKVREGILRAVEKRPVDSDSIERIITEVQQEIYAKFVLEIPSKAIGKLVLEKLFDVDAVAYVRFASVYYQYDSIDKFLTELRELKRAYVKKKARSESTGDPEPDPATPTTAPTTGREKVTVDEHAA